MRFLNGFFIIRSHLCIFVFQLFLQFTYSCFGVAELVVEAFNFFLIVVSLFVWSGVTFAMGYAETFNQLYLLRAIMGVSEALYIPAGLSLIADFHSSKTRSLAIGIHMTGFYMGQALGGFGLPKNLLQPKGVGLIPFLMFCIYCTAV